jgi:ABC-type antimicrobial peptide transport system permease subunit
VIQPRGTLSTRRMTAHRVVLAAAGLTTLVAAAIAAALAVFVGQGLPLAIQHDLAVAPGTALSIAGPVSNDQTSATASTLRRAVGQSLGGVPFGFWSGTWSGPLDLVPGSLPARPASAGKGNTPLLEAAALDGVTSHAVLVSGQWPGAPAASQVPGPRTARPPPASGEIPAALPASAAALLHLSPGDVLTLNDKIGNARISFRITGLFAPRRLTGTAASYWALNTIPASGSSIESGYTVYGPLLVSPAAFAPAPGSSGPAAAGKLTAWTGSWLAQPDLAKVTSTDLSAISSRVSALQQALLSSTVLSGLQLSTSLPSVLSATASNLSVARALFVISALQLLVLALAALIAIARLLAGQREGETALISARGATRWQLVRLTAAEVIPLCAAAAIAGALAGIRLAGLLTTGGALKPEGAKLPGPAFLLGGGGTGSPAGTWLDAIAAAVAVTFMAGAAMLGPAFRAGPAMTEARVRRGRQAAVAVATQAGADLAVVVLAVLAGWQLRRYSAASGAGLAIDPVLALAPALALAGGTVLTLRLLPAAAKAGDRLAGHGRGLTASLAGWQVSRQPLRQGGAALLLVMAVATGTLSLVQHASWARSASDQGSFDAGADARVDTPSALNPGATGVITKAAGVRHAMAVYVQSGALPTEVLAIGAAQAASTVRIRPDQVAVPAARLFEKITPKSSSGTPIPGRPDAITFTVALAPAGQPARPAGDGRVTAIARELGPVAATVTVADSTGDMYQLDAGTLPADGREHVLAASLGGAHVSYPLRLVQIALSYQMPSAQATTLALTVTGPALSGWNASATSPELDNLLTTSGEDGASADPANDAWEAGRDSATLTFSSGFGQALNYISGGPPQPVSAQVTLNDPAGSTVAPLPPLPAIATAAFADANNIGTGSVVQATVSGQPVPLSIVAVIKSFPTVTANTGALIVDLPAIQQRLVSQDATPVGVTEWWLATANHQVPPGLSGALPPGSAVTGAAEATAALTGNSLSAAPQQALLALAAAAALLAITGFWVSIAADVRQRRAENALLAALGVSQRFAALQLCLEKLLLSVPSAVLGVMIGTVVARLLVPAVTLSPAATLPAPPPVTLFDLPQTLSLAAAIAILPALAAALIMIRRPDPAAGLRAAEAA